MGSDSHVFGNESIIYMCDECTRTILFQAKYDDYEKSWFEGTIYLFATRKWHNLNFTKHLSSFSLLIRIVVFGRVLVNR